MSCSQLIEIEDLVMGNIEPARAKELRGHVDRCTACRVEETAVAKERALFMHRADSWADPPASIASSLRARLTAEVVDSEEVRARPALRGSRVGPARRGLRRGASALGRVLRRGHVSAACAALLFSLVAFSKLGGAPILPQPEADGASEDPANGRTASFSAASHGDETLACSLGGSMVTTRDDRLVSPGATTQSSPYRGYGYAATTRDELACGADEGTRASREPSVTCSTLRQ